MKGANDVEVFGASADNWRDIGVYTGCNQKSVCISETNGLRRTSRAYWRIWQVWIIAIVVSIVIPTYAFAATGDVLNYNDMAVVWGPNPVGRWGSGDADENGVIVVANSMYNAAIVTCGYSVLDSRLTHDVKAKLSNASTGGNFYTFAQTFECFQSGDGYNYPSWNRSATGVVDTIASLYGASNVWWSVYDSYLLQSAKEDLEAVLNGEDLGGGSSGSDSGFKETNNYKTVYTSQENIYLQDTSNTIYYLGGKEPYAPKNIFVTLRNITLPSFVNDEYTYFYELFYPGLYGTKRVAVRIYVFTNKEPTITYGIDDLGNKYIKSMTNLGTCYSITPSNTSLYYVYSDGIMSIDCTGVRFNAYSETSIVVPTGSLYAYEDNVTTVPPTNWPTDPTPTPVEPPEVPEPPTTTPPTQPTPPTSPTPPTYQPQPVYVTSTFTADLQGIIDAMDEHCQHIQNALYQQSKNLYEDFTTYMSDKYADLKLVLDGNFGYIGETIEDGLEDLKNYLWDLFKWLKKNMDFSFTAPEYDDSSLLSWLKKIYSKMGTGIRSKPVDPVVDPVGAWNWLEQLIQGILGALSNAVGGLTGTVGDLFDGIKAKFPFSIPWDLVAILALFDAAPVTPQATIDYTILENGPVSIPVHWDINLHYLDDTMGTVRAMEDIVFCFYLLLKTDWLSGIFDGIGDYLGGKLRVATRS